MFKKHVSVFVVVALLLCIFDAFPFSTTTVFAGSCSHDSAYTKKGVCGKCGAILPNKNNNVSVQTGIYETTKELNGKADPYAAAKNAFSSKISSGEPVEVIGAVENGIGGSDHIWYKVKYNGKTCWIFSGNLKKHSAHDSNYVKKGVCSKCGAILPNKNNNVSVPTGIYVTVDAVNAKVAPYAAANNAFSSKIPAGKQVTVIRAVENGIGGSDHIWYEVIYNGVDCWIFPSHLKRVEAFRLDTYFKNVTDAEYAVLCGIWGDVANKKEPEKEFLNSIKKRLPVEDPLQALQEDQMQVVQGITGCSVLIIGDSEHQNALVIFAPTNGQLLDFLTDAQIFTSSYGVGGSTYQSQLANDTVDKLSKKYANIVVTGYSLGGFLATSTALQHDKVSKCIAFDPPGRGEFDAADWNKKSASKKVTTYEADGSEVSGWCGRAIGNVVRLHITPTNWIPFTEVEIPLTGVKVHGMLGFHNHKIGPISDFIAKQCYNANNADEAIKASWTSGVSYSATYEHEDETTVSPSNSNNTGGYNPQGNVDEITGGTGEIRIRGWAFDKDDPNKSIELHVYIGGPAGSGEGHAGIIADQGSSDVNNAFGISGNHRFDTTITTSKSGTQSVYIYALNMVGGGTNVEIGHGTVTISEAKKNALDLNGILDGKESGDIAGYGTADVYTNGSLAADDCTDYYTQLPVGTRYEIKDIKAAKGKRYEGLKFGSLSGTIGSSDVDVRMIYTTQSQQAEETTYTLYYNALGGIEPPSPVTVTAGEKFKISSIKPTKDGYKFLGWSESASAASADYVDYIAGDSIKLDRDTTLYAVWERKGTNMVLTIGSAMAKVNGETRYNDVAPLIENSRTMLPARFVAENLGAKVEWDGETRSVIVSTDDTVVLMYIDSATAFVNGYPVTLDSAPFIRDSRTYTPVRFICESLGAAVGWDESTRQVTITK